MTFENGLKFAESEVTADLAAVAAAYLASYTGGFDFLRDLKLRGKPLTTGQAKGVLNCMLAEQRKAEAKLNPPAPVAIAGMVEYFAEAAKHLKFPKVRLLCGCAEGHEFILTRKGAKSAHPGAIDVLSRAKEWNPKFQDFAPRWFGRVDADGSVTQGRDWAHYEATVRRFAENPLEVASEYGRLTGNCCFCGRELTDERSTEAGYGPICAKKYGLEWGNK